MNPKIINAWTNTWNRTLFKLYSRGFQTETLLKDSQAEIKIVRASPSCSLLQQKIIQKANSLIQKTLRILDSVFIINENVSLQKSKHNK